MTPNNEVKAKLFSLYYGQNCRHQSNPTISDYLPPDIVTGRVIEVVADGKYPDAFLELRSIEQLEDEELAILASDSAYRLTDKNISKVGIAMARHLFELNKWSGDTILTMTDYLRSIGIALPYCYLDDNHKPVTASVSEQVEWGWVKIVEK